MSQAAMSAASDGSQMRSGSHMPRGMLAESCPSRRPNESICPRRSACDKHRQDRVVIRAAQISIRPAVTSSRRRCNVFRMPRGEPIDERSAGVQIDRQRRIIGQRLDQRQITIAIDAFVDRIQIADRLMLVQHQHEAQRVVMAKSVSRVGCDNALAMRTNT